MEQVKVSIIIPCYNQAIYLVETLVSVIEQTYINWECIIINDGSTDNSEEVILQYIKDDTRFKYINQKNSGVCIARNNAIKQSLGEYILCLDGDDLISENYLDETVKILDSKPEVKVATSIVRYFGRSKGFLKVVSYDLATLLAQNQLVITSLFRRSDFDRVGGFNINMKEGLEDWDFWISVLKKGGEVQCAKQALFYYRLQNVSRNSQITTEKEKKLRYQMWQNHKELFSEYFVEPTKCFEYIRCADSIEYKVGSIIIKPVRKLKFWFSYFKIF